MKWTYDHTTRPNQSLCLGVVRRKMALVSVNEGEVEGLRFWLELGERLMRRAYDDLDASGYVCTGLLKVLSSDLQVGRRHK